MKTDQILLDVLMTDERYAARIQELKSLTSKLDEKIAQLSTMHGTLEQLQIKLASVKEKEAAFKVRQAELEEDYRQKNELLLDDMKAKKLSLEERAAVERKQYEDVRVKLDQALKVQKDVDLKLADINAKMQGLRDMQEELNRREQALASKIKKVNEAFHG